MVVEMRPQVNFVLVETPEPEPLYYPFVPHVNCARYPSNWSKVSWLVRKTAGFRCAWCCCADGRQRVHHMGVPYVTGQAGNKYDKHDLRIENLYPLCQACERKADKLFKGVKPDKSVYADDEIYRERERQLRNVRKHRALGVGTGLVVWSPTR